MRVIYLINYIRTILVVLICLILKIEGIVKEDLKRNLWYIGSENANLSSLNKNLLKISASEILYVIEFMKK